jgi:hypothetical protein
MRSAAGQLPLPFTVSASTYLIMNPQQCTMNAKASALPVSGRFGCKLLDKSSHLARSPASATGKSASSPPTVNDRRLPIQVSQEACSCLDHPCADMTSTFGVLRLLQVWKRYTSRTDFSPTSSCRCLEIRSKREPFLECFLR